MRQSGGRRVTGNSSVLHFGYDRSRRSSKSSMQLARTAKRRQSASELIQVEGGECGDKGGYSRTVD